MTNPPPRLSVIVPVYKSEPYLEECVESILAQTFTDFELILVEDGSPDRSGKLCDELALKFPDKIKVIHKENGGAASARNAGLAIARGEYIGFIDSDDTILPDMFQYMIESIEKFQADVLETKFILPGKDAYMDTDVRFFSGREALIEMLNWRLSTSLCTKIFRREILDGILMDEGHTNEDFRYICDVFLKDAVVCVSPRAFYNYRETPGSVTRVVRPGFFDLFGNLDYLDEKLPQNDKALRKSFRRYSLTMHIMSGVKIVKGRLNKVYKEWIRINRKFIWKNSDLIFFDKNLSLRWRLKAVYSFLRLP